MTNPAHRNRRWRTPTCRITTLVPFLLICTFIVTFWVIMGESPSAPPDLPTGETTSHLVYTAVPGYFAQSLLETDDVTFDLFQTPDFGLLSRPYDSDVDLPPATLPWQRFSHALTTRNRAAPRGTSHRLLLLGRHGQGVHNVAEAFFGTEQWDCCYSALDGSPNATWADAHLTPQGVRQVQRVSDYWAAQVRERGMPRVQSWYVSPLDRAMRTAEITVAGAAAGDVQPVVKERLREGIGIHTCDRRSRRAAIAAAYPAFAIEADFAPDDPLWEPDRREPGAAQTARLKMLLDDVLSRDASTWISMTSHGGTIQSILRAVGHRPFTVKTGGVIPVVVKVERREGHAPEEVEVPWEKKPECEGGEPEPAEVRDRLIKFDEHMKEVNDA